MTSQVMKIDNTQFISIAELSFTSFILQQQVPDGPPGAGVHSGRRFVKNDRLGATDKRNGDRELALHAS